MTAPSYRCSIRVTLRDAVPINETQAPRGHNQSLARGLMILDALSAHGGELGVRELSRKLGLNKSTVQRLVQTFVGAGFLEQNPVTAKYRIGHRAFEVGYTYLRSAGLVESAMPLLSSMANGHELNAILGVLRTGTVVYLLAVPSSGPVVLRSRPGLRAPAHATAVGKALLAGESDESLDAILAAGPLERFTTTTVVDVAELTSQIQEVRRTGYAIADGEFQEGIIALGAPIYDATGQVVAAISASAPRYLLGDERIDDTVRVVVDTAASISRSLGANNHAQRTASAQHASRVVDPVDGDGMNAGSRSGLG